MAESLKGRLLVAAQFALIAWLLWPFTPLRDTAAAQTFAAAAATVALLLGAWTLWWNRPGNFNIRPELKAGGRLVIGGPYAWVRHPMYSSLLLFAAAAALAYADPLKCVAWGALAIVLRIKADLEERALRQRFPEYAAYAAKTGGFLPGLP